MLQDLITTSLLNSRQELKYSTYKSPMATTEKSPASSGGHVPLSSSLSQIVARELGGGGAAESAPVGTSATTSGASSSPTEEAEAPSTSSSTAAAVQGRSHEEEDASAALVHQRQLAVAQQLVVQHRAEAILRQRQLEQLEQLRQVQALSLLYPPTVTPGLGSSALLVEALLAQRQQQQQQQQQLLAAAQLANAARATRPQSGSAGAGMGLSAHDEAEESSTRENGASARNVPKRAVDKLPEDLDSNKKQKRETSSDDNDDDSSKGHRFRPYQYEQWTEKFQELTDFKKEKGHCQVPHTYTENPPLARWVKRQRYQYKLKMENKQSTMTDERVRLLEEIGFIWDSHAAAWAEKLHELKEYAELRGDCNVPSTYPANPQLATWVKCQRRQYKLLRDAKTSNMTIERIRQLESIGFIWEVRKSWDSSRA